MFPKPIGSDAWYAQKFKNLGSYSLSLHTHTYVLRRTLVAKAEMYRGGDRAAKVGPPPSMYYPLLPSSMVLNKFTLMTPSMVFFFNDHSMVLPMRRKTVSYLDSCDWLREEAIST
jgi:hypothetical protein